MKYLAIGLLLCMTSVTSAQNTTQEEYNFMIKGYQQMLESGLDMKKGYQLEDTVAFTALANKYNIVFMNLVRVKDKSLAGTISIVNSKISNRKYYLGMIASDGKSSIDHESTLLVQLTNFAWDASIRTAFLQALSEYLSLRLTKSYVKSAK